MKKTIVLITTLPDLVEIKRLREEAEKLNFEFRVVDLGNFSFDNFRGKVEIPGLSDLKADFVIVRGVFKAIKAVSVAVNSLRASGVKVFDNNFLEHQYSIDKVTDILKLSLGGIPTPKTFYGRDFLGYPAAAQKLGYPVVVKSVRSGKGANVYLAQDQGKLDLLIGNLMKEGKEAKSYLMQEFIDYRYDLRCLVIGRKVFTMRRIPQKGEFRANFSLGGTVKPFKITRQTRELAVKALKTVGMGIGGVDILIDRENNKYLLEVNHTAGFVGMETAWKQNIAKEWLKYALKNAR